MYLCCSYALLVFTSLYGSMMKFECLRLLESKLERGHKIKQQKETILGMMSILLVILKHMILMQIIY